MRKTKKRKYNKIKISISVVNWNKHMHTHTHTMSIYNKLKMGRKQKKQHCAHTYPESVMELIKQSRDKNKIGKLRIGKYNEREFNKVGWERKRYTHTNKHLQQKGYYEFDRFCSKRLFSSAVCRWFSSLK